MAKKRIGILTGGGDVPGLNSVIKSVVYRGAERGCEVLGIRRGWEGLTHLDLNDPASKAHYILPLDRENTRTIDRTGGTFLHSSRTNPTEMKKLPPVLEGQTFERYCQLGVVGVRLRRFVADLRIHQTRVTSCQTRKERDRKRRWLTDRSRWRPIRKRF
jgi:hypothetical protein